MCAQGIPQLQCLDTIVIKVTNLLSCFSCSDQPQGYQQDPSEQPQLYLLIPI